MVRRYNVAMHSRLSSILIAVLALAGCAHDARSYRPAEGSVNETQERAFAACRANAEPILKKSGSLMGLTAYDQSITDCMRDRGYTKL
jgi:hypothetical protein